MFLCSLCVSGFFDGGQLSRLLLVTFSMYGCNDRMVALSFRTESSKNYRFDCAVVLACLAADWLPFHENTFVNSRNN